MSKFENTLAEAAYAIAGHGFSDDEYGSVQDIGWNAVVTLNATTLLNIGEVTMTAWIREDNEGFVTVIEQSADVAEVETKWDAFLEECRKATEDHVNEPWTGSDLAEFGGPETGWTGR